MEFFTVPTSSSQGSGVMSSSPLQATASDIQASPSAIAMPPPPNMPAPPLQLRNSPRTSAEKAPDSPASKQSLLTTTTFSKHQPRGIKEKAAANQPPSQDRLTEWEDKKLAKRAANRLSAHLSRKRKKMFIDELKDENAELRRKELILRSIPDLIIVFNASGCISFVSHSVTRFLNYTVEELEYTSFWALLTEESVRLIKSTFMDALSVRRLPGEDSTPLANGESMAVKMVYAKDRDKKVKVDDGKSVSLKGVVHFTNDTAECVCSIRPENNGKGTGLDTKKVEPVVNKFQQRETASGPVGAPSFHQISDIDSEKS